MIISNFYVYILTNNSNTVVYTGVTNNLIRRVIEHKTSLNEGFTKKYNVKKLVYFELFQDINQAIAREKQIKGYSREKKNNLINSINPEWAELFENNEIKIPLKNKIMKPDDV
jgi:putative endonuclease